MQDPCLSAFSIQTSHLLYTGEKYHLPSCQNSESIFRPLGNQFENQNYSLTGTGFAIACFEMTPSETANCLKLFISR